MQISSIPLAQSVVLLCLSKGINHIVISPGSRNAPLTISFSNHPEIKAFSVVDERSAAFVALGMAQQLNKPVGLLCTSGSALLNYYPAIAEAFYSDVPLVVISADRPVERIDIGDGQTIRQKNVFSNHILYEANLHSEVVTDVYPNDEKIQQKFGEAKLHNQREINLALNTAIEKNGPVHINVPFYEPLYGLVDKPTVAPLLIEPNLASKKLEMQEVKPFADKWSKAKRKLIIVGVLAPNSIEQQYLEILVKDPSVLIFTETTSNLHHPNLISRIDKLIAPLENIPNPAEAFEKLQPDILISLGGLIISKKVKAFLRNYQPKEHWHVGTNQALNTYFCLNKHFDVTINHFFSVFFPMIKEVESDYQAFWINKKNQRDTHHQAYMENLPFSDLKAFEYLVQNLPQKQLVHFSNSSIIRYAQLFKFKPHQYIYCNRGTSGIDGSSSTAIGAAIVSDFPTTLVTGDLSFFYDSNALWNNYIPHNFKIILINNGGGGIFKILPGAQENPTFETYFETKHQLNASHLCKMYGFEYHCVHQETTLADCLSHVFQQNDKPQLVEIFTGNEPNDVWLKNYFKYKTKN
ncbi:2-succinyl-5-enolpyruvyl-6-hydroxy-3-cyclohexene-1-carboxylic-acid synthase [uncultured Mesonia sp.]|uniref:2-succinyl-5-enolpyruvyl-6-hydroxy-3- cyclohexene-1-carboxylic-acid synthase n=1 Tax=uncultured Mesonia sp. TaxID=399731 RepID=UPI00374F0C3E